MRWLLANFLAQQVGGGDSGYLKWAHRLDGLLVLNSKSITTLPRTNLCMFTDYAVGTVCVLLCSRFNFDFGVRLVDGHVVFCHIIPDICGS